MIRENEPIKWSQDRKVWPVYQEPWDPNYDPKNFGRPIRMESAREIRFTLSVDVFYDEAHAPLIHKLLGVANELREEVCKCDGRASP